MEASPEMALQSVTVPQASYHIEVSADGAPITAEPPPPKPRPPEPAAVSGGSRPVVLVRCGPDAHSPAAEGRSVKYMLTGLPAAASGTGTGATPLRSPTVATTGQSRSAARARQILKKRLDLSLAEKKYTKAIHPELVAGEVDENGEPLTVSAPTPVMICEPEAADAQKQGRTFFFVAKPPEEADAESQPEEPLTPQLPDHPAQTETPPLTDSGILKKLARYKLSERYEILPAASMEDAEEIMHKLRLQNLSLKTELVRQATEVERHGDEHGLRFRRGRKKATTIVAVDRLRELEKIEAGMNTLFTPSQVKALSRDYKKNSVQWRDEDFRRALGLLENSSQHTFNYVRKVMNVPLPSIGTLKLRCPQQPELQVRLEAALQERGRDIYCKTGSLQVSSAAAADQGAAGDTAEQIVGEYQEVETLPAEDQQLEWFTETHSRGVLKRKRPKGGAAAARRAVHQDEEVVFYEAPTQPTPRDRRRRSSSGEQQDEGVVFYQNAAPVRPRGRGGRGRGSGFGGGRRRGRPGLVAPYQPPSPSPPPAIDDDEEDDDEEEPEDDEDDFEEEFGEEEGDVEVDPQQQEVPAQFGQFRTAYEGGWTEWDPRQLH